MRLSPLALRFGDALDIGALEAELPGDRSRFHTRLQRRPDDPFETGRDRARSFPGGWARTAPRYRVSTVSATIARFIYRQAAPTRLRRCRAQQFLQLRVVEMAERPRKVTRQGEPGRIHVVRPASGSPVHAEPALAPSGFRLPGCGVAIPCFACPLAPRLARFPRLIGFRRGTVAGSTRREVGGRRFRRVGWAVVGRRGRRRQRPTAVLRLIPALSPTRVQLHPDRRKLDQPFRVGRSTVQDFPRRQPRPVAQRPFDQSTRRTSRSSLASARPRLARRPCRARPSPPRPRRRFSRGPERRQYFLPGIRSTARVGLGLDLRHQRRKPAGCALRILRHPCVPLVVTVMPRCAAFRRAITTRDAPRNRDERRCRNSGRNSRKARSSPRKRRKQISAVLDHFDSRRITLPEFQRGYVWNRDQVRALSSSLIRSMTSPGPGAYRKSNGPTPTALPAASKYACRFSKNSTMTSSPWAPREMSSI